ncbi:MAG: hypothetical protein NTU67_11065 [Gemmatimonadetes bacterium]|nr:hypothetical protein [Gemmatimonadota bacterium]
MGDPPVDNGAVNFRETLPFPDVATTLLGAPGAVAAGVVGVTVAAGCEALQAARPTI